MIVEQSKRIIEEVGKAFIGKTDLVEKVLMTIYAGGHVLLEDCPGVGKTTLAMAFSKALGLQNKRIQFTPDTLPSDITGFTMYNRESNRFEYRDGAANCQLLLADEINRTSPKTQSALLEVMEEHTITVDGKTHALPTPFLCIATQNPLGSAGTQPLPESQLDRFMVSLSMGYPDHASLVELLRDRQKENPLEHTAPVLTREELLSLQEQVQKVYVSDAVLDYAVSLSEATRANELITLGLSPRGTLALMRMAKAHAFMEKRDYVVPKDVQAVFADVAGHRMVLDTKARYEDKGPRQIQEQILLQVPVPRVDG